jgi:hypothetical protein
MAKDHHYETVSFDKKGFKKLQELAKGNPAFANEIADELETSPRSVLLRLFHLTAHQTQAVANTSDDILRVRALPIITALRSGEPEKIIFIPGAGSPPDSAVHEIHHGSGSEKWSISCSCTFKS